MPLTGPSPNSFSGLEYPDMSRDEDVDCGVDEGLPGKESQQRLEIRAHL